MGTTQKRHAPTILQQTGWQRPFPQCICQDLKVLQRISIYSFDLSDRKFRDYVAARTGVVYDYGTPAQIAERIDFYQNWSDDDIRSRPDFTYADQTSVSIEDRAVWIKIVRISRGKLQDCWELYQNHQARVQPRQRPMFARAA